MDEIKSPDDEPASDNEVVVMLEVLLDEAIAGRLQNVAVAMVHSNGATNCIWRHSGDNGRHSLHAAIADLFFESGRFRADARDAKKSVTRSTG